MGQTILTPKQLDFLQLAQIQASITKNFYLTGGTALMEQFFLRLAKSLDKEIFK